MTRTTKLTTRQAEALLEAASVNVAELPTYRYVTRQKLVDLGLITGPKGAHVITPAGLAWVLENHPEAPVSDAHRLQEPKLTATQKLARLQAEAPRHECGLSRQGIDCMCADAAELDVDTETGGEEGDDAAPAAELLLTSSLTGEIWSVRGTAYDADGTVSGVWYGDEERGYNVLLVAEMQAPGVRAVCEHLNSIDAFCSDCRRIGTAPFGSAPVRQPGRDHGATPDGAAAILDTVTGRTLFVLATERWDGSEITGVVFRYLNDDHEAGAPVRQTTAGRLMKGTRYVAVCPHSKPLGVDCPACAEADPAVPELAPVLDTAAAERLWNALYPSDEDVAKIYHLVLVRFLAGDDGLFRIEGTTPGPVGTLVWLTPVGDDLLASRPSFPVLAERFSRADAVACCHHGLTVNDTCPNCDAEEDHQC